MIYTMSGKVIEVTHKANGVFLVIRATNQIAWASFEIDNENVQSLIKELQKK